MKFALGALLASLPLLAAFGAIATPGDEPPLQLVLELDGKEHLLSAGTEATVDVGGAKVRAKVRVLPVRHFQAAGVAFDYPQDMTWSHEKDHSWHLNRADLRVSLWTFAGGDPQKHAQSLLQATAKSLAGAETPVEAVELGTPGGARAGIRARVATKAGNIARHVEAYGFTAGGKAAVLLWIGAPEDFATPEAAGSALRTQIARTLQVAD